MDLPLRMACIVAATAFALVGGMAVASGIQERRGREARRRAASSDAGSFETGRSGEGLAHRIVACACDFERRAPFASRRASPLRARHLSERSRERFARDAAEAGVAGLVGPCGCGEVRLRLACACAIVGALAGAALSPELACALGAAGAVVGARSIRWALRSLASDRSAALERDLPEMLEVVALGLRSGLTFDRSFALYHEHFDTVFSRECASAQRRWSLGLVSRDDALKGLASGYDSPLLRRTIDSSVRSLRFGTSLAETFEAQADEARAVRKARREERVAKAPVKMMVPTGALILPAMLLLVLGPVLLELMEGF